MPRTPPRTSPRTSPRTAGSGTQILAVILLPLLLAGLGGWETLRGTATVAAYRQHAAGLAVQLARVNCTPAKLEAMGIVAAPDPVRPARALPPGRPGEYLRWPSYQRCLDGAPANHANTEPDMSRADFTWCKIAADWGWDAQEIAHRLSEESAKAQENGEAYARLTATRAAQASARGGREPS